MQKNTCDEVFFVEQLRALLYSYKNCVTWSRGVFSTQSNIYDGSFLEKKNFSKKLYHRCVRVGSKYASVMMPPDNENQSMLKKASLRIFVNFITTVFQTTNCFPNINLSIFSYWKLLNVNSSHFHENISFILIKKKTNLLPKQFLLYYYSKKPKTSVNILFPWQYLILAYHDLEKTEGEFPISLIFFSLCSFLISFLFPISLQRFLSYI